MVFNNKSKILNGLVAERYYVNTGIDEDKERAEEIRNTKWVMIFVWLDDIDTYNALEDIRGYFMSKRSRYEVERARERH